MKKKVTCLLITLLSINVSAHSEIKTAEIQSVLKPINNMFDAMREHDGNKFLAQFTQQAILERANKINEIEISNLSTLLFLNFFLNVSKKNPQ